MLIKLIQQYPEIALIIMEQLEFDQKIKLQLCMNKCLYHWIQQILPIQKWEFIMNIIEVNE